MEIIFIAVSPHYPLPVGHSVASVSLRARSAGPVEGHQDGWSLLARRRWTFASSAFSISVLVSELSSSSSHFSRCQKILHSFRIEDRFLFGNEV